MKELDWERMKNIEFAVSKHLVSNYSNWSG